MRHVPLPMVDSLACAATGWCVAVCPTDCLDLWNDRPSLKYPARCLSCSACVKVCPTEAMRLEDLTTAISSPPAP